jgi:hypothetical protein
MGLTGGAAGAVLDGRMMMRTNRDRFLFALTSATVRVNATKPLAGRSSNSMTCSSGTPESCSVKRSPGARSALVMSV